MAKEFFKNLPDTSTPLNASRLNGLLNGNEAMGSIVVEDVKCKNLFNKGTIVNGWLNYANNVLMESHQSNYVTSDYISVKPNTTYTLNLFNSESLSSGGIMFYDGAKNWISPGIPETQTVITFTTTSDTEYVRFVLRNDAKDNVQIEEGTTATEYTPYKRYGFTSDVEGDIAYLEKNTVRTKFLGENPNINNMHYQNGTYGLYNCLQAPVGGIGILEVLVYSADWATQRYTYIETDEMWQRHFYGGTAWSEWEKKY